MEWNHVDLDKKIWTKPAKKTKSGKVHKVPLSDAAVAVLRRIQSTSDSRSAFPPVRGGSVKDIRKSWDTVRQRAGIEHIRVHSLRHTFASILVSDGVSIPFIANLLGHSTYKTSERYAHIADEPLRRVVDAVGDKITQAPSAAVIELHDKEAG